MKKQERPARKKPVVSKRTQNPLLPAQVSRQLRKHYVNKYGVGSKGNR